MYLTFFNMEEFPFTLAPNVDYFCELPGHQTAINVLLVSLRTGEGFVKITGEVGTGKSLLCHKLLACLDKEFVTAYVPTPDLSPAGLRSRLAKELGLQPKNDIEQHDLLELINDKLIQLKGEGKQVVLFLDEAQAIPDETLEAIRLLTNLETETSKLLQVILFAQPELNQRLNKRSLRQLKQRITNSYHLQPLDRTNVGIYVHHRLSVAGCPNPTKVLSKAAVDLLFRCSRGIPRLINIITHKALMVAYGRGRSQIRAGEMRQAIRDTEDSQTSSLLTKHILQRVMLYGAAFVLGSFIALKLRLLTTFF